MKKKFYTFAEITPHLLKGKVVRRHFDRMDSAKYYYFIAKHWGTGWLYCYMPEGDKIEPFSCHIYFMEQDLRDKIWSIETDKKVLGAISKVRNLNNAQ